jgi:hypothetical protein
MNQPPAGALTGCPHPPAIRTGCSSALTSWHTSGLPWGDYRRAWAQEEGPHTGQDTVGELDARFDRQLLAYGPISLTDWQASAKVIDAGQIQATRIAYIGRRRREGPASHPDRN